MPGKGSTCTCLGVAAAKVPVKRYNLLVPAIYPTIEPSYDKPFNMHTEKALKKLMEYLERNEHRIPKVSRRLARRLYKDVSHRKWAFAHISVLAYIQLIQMAEGRHVQVYATELVVRSAVKGYRFIPCSGPATSPKTLHLGSVIGTLLSNPAPQPRCLGCQLLVEFLKLQDDGSYLDELEAFIPFLTRDANLKKTGSKEEEVVANSLRALLEHFRFCTRIGHVSQHLDLVTDAVLDTLEATSAGRLPPARGSRDMRAALEAGINPMALRQMSIGVLVGTSPPGVAAQLVYEEMGHSTKDAIEGRRLLQFLMQYLDAVPSRWLGGPALATGLESFRRASDDQDQRYVVFSTLVRHAGRATALPPDARAAVISQALQDALALNPVLLPAALMLIIQEVMRSTANSNLESGSGGEVQTAALHAVRQLSCRLGQSMQLAGVLSAVLSQLPRNERGGALGLLCCAAAAEALHQNKPVHDLVVQQKQSAQVSSMLVRSLLDVCMTRSATQRVLAHKTLTLLFSQPGCIIKADDISSVLSAVWHEIAALDNTPAVFVAIYDTLASLVATGSSETQLVVCLLVAQLRSEVSVARLPTSSHLQGLSAAQQVAVIYLAIAVWSAASQQLQQGSLNVFELPQEMQVLSSLVVSGAGLNLGVEDGDGISGARRPDDKVNGGELTEDVLVASMKRSMCEFTAEEDTRAAAALESEYALTAAGEFEAKARSALQGVSVFKRLMNGDGQTELFKALPAASLTIGSREERQPTLQSNAPSRLAKDIEPAAATGVTSAPDMRNDIALNGCDDVVTSSAGSMLLDPPERVRPPTTDEVMAQVEAALIEAKRGLLANGTDNPAPATLFLLSQ